MVDQPDNILSKEKMTAILYDMAILNSAKNTNPKVLVENNIEIMDYIYEKHSIDSLQFVESDVYYAALPEAYQEIYKGVEQRLDRMKEKMDTEARQKLDSTRQRNLAKDSLAISKKKE